VATNLGDTAKPVAPLPPNFVRDNFLDPAEHAALLDWVLANRERFETAEVTDGNDQRVNEAVRVALRLPDLGPLEATLSARLLEALPAIVAAIGARLPPLPSLDLELTAYGHGAFYAPHTDIAIGPGRRPIGPQPGEDRLLSAVYYFHYQPKRFEGGALRLFRIGVRPEEAGAGDRIDIAPDDNRLVAFPAWAAHAVRPVACPSGRFEDFRFALNCWYVVTPGAAA
jgi:predicted 2-oxoglutarate/Fe(II)-dependent dioxygenase YbiX